MQRSQDHGTAADQASAAGWIGAGGPRVRGQFPAARGGGAGIDADGRANQQTSRHLSPITIEKRDLTVKRFVAFTNDYPWRWSSADVEE